MRSLRREPFRLLFPLGVLLGLAGVLPWLLLAHGAIATWPGTWHPLVMTEGFWVCIACGFLGTMLPRRTGAAPLGRLELTMLVAGSLAVPVALAAGSVPLAQLGYLATLAQFAVRRLLARRPSRSPPPSFVFIPIGLVAAGVGAAMLAAQPLAPAPWSLPLGRGLVEQGLLLALVLALAPMLSPILADGQAPEDAPPPVRRLRIALHALAAVALASSFPLELRHARAGLLLRGALCAVELVVAGELGRGQRLPGLHRRLYRLALLLVPVGLLAAGAWPARRVPLLHLSFIGGLSLLVYAVSIHVVLLHTGREALARRSSVTVGLIAALTIAATAIRAAAEQAPNYFVALGVAATLWLAGATAWLVFVVPKLARRG